jgi:hypothetical protein
VDFLGRVPTIAAVAEPWPELPAEVQGWWLGEAVAVLRAAARGTVKVALHDGFVGTSVWVAVCRHCSWRRYGGLVYAHRHGTYHAATHWGWLS